MPYHTQKQHVALTRCFYCGEGNEILLASRYHNTSRGMEPVRDLAQYDGKVINKRPCPKCEGYMKQGVILIGVRDGESGENPYRSGHFSVVRDEAIRRIFDSASANACCRSRVAFIEESVGKQIGVFPEKGGDA